MRHFFPHPLIENIVSKSASSGLPALFGGLLFDFIKMLYFLLDIHYLEHIVVRRQKTCMTVSI